MELQGIKQPADANTSAGRSFIHLFLWWPSDNRESHAIVAVMKHVRRLNYAVGIIGCVDHQAIARIDTDVGD